METPRDVEGLPKVGTSIQLNELQFEKKISSGGFGEVWKASYLGTDVAVKRMEIPEDSFLMRLIQREIIALREIRHPNICLFLGLCTDGKHYHLVTEYIHGGNLWKLLRNKNKQLTWITRLSLAIDTAKAMTFLHAKNIMHRDLKCENLLVDKSMQLKVCDFGLCRGDMTEENKKFMTRAGTESWMAPEVIIGSPYSLKADSFSFGVVLYEIITRERPPDRSPMTGYNFEMDTFAEHFPPDCPPELATLTFECVSPDPDSRPSFMNILNRLKDIQAKLKDEQKQTRATNKLAIPPPIEEINPILASPTPSLNNLPPSLSHSLPPSLPSSPSPPTHLPPPGGPERLNAPHIIHSHDISSAPVTPDMAKAKKKAAKKKAIAESLMGIASPGSPIPPPLSIESNDTSAVTSGAQSTNHIVLPIPMASFTELSPPAISDGEQNRSSKPNSPRDVHSDLISKKKRKSDLRVSKKREEDKAIGIPEPISISSPLPPEIADTNSNENTPSKLKSKKPKLKDSDGVDLKEKDKEAKKAAKTKT